VLPCEKTYRGGVVKFNRDFLWKLPFAEQKPAMHMQANIVNKTTFFMGCFSPVQLFKFTASLLCYHKGCASARAKRPTAGIGLIGIIEII